MNPPPRTHRSSRPSISALPSASILTEPPKRGPRQSVNPTTTIPPAKIAHKKRSKSLGGATLEQHVRNGNLDDPESLTLTLELTPRKKARRSLVPGKSILKSRPTVTGLERISSDNNLTSGFDQSQTKRNSNTNLLPSAVDSASQAVQTLDQPSNVAPVAPPEPQPTDKQDIDYESTRMEQDGDDQAGSDISSDMDVSDEQALHRISLGSNATNLLRRVSFAAKAHVRTFGSPILDPDSSVVSSAPSAVAEDTPAPAAHSSLRPGGGMSDEDSSADMSIDNSLLTDRPADSDQPAGQAEASSNMIPTGLTASNNPVEFGVRSAAEQFKQYKASRLSVAIPGFGYDEDDDEDDEGNGDVTMQDLDPDEINRVTAPDFASKVAGAVAPKLAVTAAERDVADEPMRNAQEHSQDMDLTTPFQPISNNAINAHKSSYIPRLSTASKKGFARSQSATSDQQPTSDQHPTLKGSRLSVAFPEYSRENENQETENLMDLSPNLSGQGNQTRLTLAQMASNKNVPHSQSVANNQQRTFKGSRLSMAFPEYARENEAEETENLMDISPPASGQRNQTRLTATHDGLRKAVPHSQAVTNDQQFTLKGSRLSMAFPEYARENEEDETENLMDLSPPVSGQGNQTRPTLTHNASKRTAPHLQSVSNQQQPTLKDSRLSVDFPEYTRENESEQTGNPMDLSSTFSSQGIQTRSTVTHDTSKKAAARSQLITHQQPMLKGSRLSTAFPEYAGDNDGEETSNLMDISTAASNLGKHTRPMVTKDASASFTSSSFNKVPEVRPAPKVNQVGLAESTSTKKGSRLTNFLGYAEDEDDEADTLARDGGDGASVPTGPEHALSPSRSAKSDVPESDSVINPGRGLRSHGTGVGLEPTHVQTLPSEPTNGKRRSRITEFLQREDSPNQDGEDSAMIDFTDHPANVNFQPPRGSRLSAPLHGLEVIKEDEDDFMHESFEYSTLPGPTQDPVVLTSNQASRSLHASTTSHFGPSQAISQADMLLKSSTTSSRSSDIRRGPPVRALKNSLQITSASPARRLSGSLSGSPRPRPSFPSPRRSGISARSSLDPGSPPGSLTAPAKDFGSHSRASYSHATGSANAHLPRELGTAGLRPPASITVGPSQSRSPPKPPSPPAPAAAPTITLNEFFEQAEICFISLSQPRVRNHDQQEQFISPEAQKGVSSFAEQIFAGMVKIPRVRMLESSSRILRQKTEMLDNVTKEHEREIEQNPNRYKLLREWLNLQQKQANLTQPGSQAAQKHADELNKLMNQLRLKKNLVEISSKRDSTEFGLEMWRAYQVSLNQRREKLRHDLEMMRKMSSIVEPSADALRSRKLYLTEEIRRRKQKKAEIDNCDQNQLKALKEEAKDLAAETEANRRALAESDFERNMWSTKLAELEEEKTDHMERIEQMRRDPDQSQKCTLQELIRLQNEFVMLQRLMGWELVRFEDDLIELLLLSSITVTFHLDSFNPRQTYRNVGRIELRWTRPSPRSAKGTDPHKDLIEEFFFSHLRIHFHGKRLEGRMKDFVQQIVAMWNHARQLTYEVLNLRTRFKIRLKLTPQSNSRVSSFKGSNNLQVMVAIHSRRTQTSVDALFEFNGEEVLDWKADSNISHISCKVSCYFGKPDCSNLTYIIREHVDRGNRGALKEACLEAWGALESPQNVENL